VTVKELIEKLKEFPEDMTVVTCGEEFPAEWEDGEYQNRYSHYVYNPMPKIHVIKEIEKRYVKMKVLASRPCDDGLKWEKAVVL